MKADKHMYNDMKENLLWITIMIFAFFSYFKGEVFTVILIFWIIQILFSGNVRRLFLKDDSNIIMLIRRSLYIIPLLFPMILGFKFNIIPINLSIFLWSIIGILIGVTFILPKIKTWQLYLSYDMICFSNKRKKFDYFSMMAVLIFTPICEEYFFRNFIILNTKNLIGYGSIIFSAYLFFIHHFEVKWSEDFSKYDFFIQLLFGIICGGIFYYSESIIPSIFAHLTYNSMNILLEIRGYRYHYLISKENAP